MAKFGFGLSRQKTEKSPKNADSTRVTNSDKSRTGAQPHELSAPQPYLHLLHQVKSQPDALGLITPEGDFTFRQIFDISKRIAAVLRKRGVQPGQVVVTSVNTHENFHFMLAMFHEGVIGGIAPVRLTQKLASSFDWLIAVEPRAEVPLSKTILIDSAFQADFEQASTITDPVLYADFDSYCRLIFSSGTTGEPKAVPFSLAMIEARNEYSRESWMNIQPFMSMITMAGISGFATAYATLVSGKPYLSPGTEKENLGLVARHKVASFKASPRQLSALLELIKAEPEKAESIQCAMTAGSELPYRLGVEFGRIADCEVTNGLGSTEAGLITKRTELSEDPADMGTLVPGAQVEIVDQDDNVLPVGQTGQMRWKRDHMATEYFNNPADSAVNFRNGWFYPGDFGYFAANGHLFLAGRQSELINVGGAKLNPARVDHFVTDFPGVIDAVSFAFVNPSGTSDFGLALVASKDLDRNGLTKAIRDEYQGVAPGAIIVVSKIKRNALGKPLRAEHAQDLQNLLAKRAKA